DYRFLVGTIQDNKMYLSCFDGSHAFLFEAKVLEDKTLIGSFRSGTHYKSTWSAKRNPDFKLDDASTLTYLKNKDDKFTFAFPNTEGKTISLEDEKYQGKAKIIQILGTWCPNCADETEFLMEYLKNNPNEDLEVIGLAFEKHKTADKTNAALNTFKKRFDVNYEVLWAGSSSKSKAAEALPMLNAIISYPTMIFLDKNNNVTYIHTGFSGPATSKYEGFKKDFDKRVKQLVKEGN
ncbi:MAG: TlpA disulfide reductase family protein, partial [Saprospiraceae bacterium]